MRKIFSFMFASLDGYHETHERSLDWQDVDDEFDAFDRAQLDEADTLLLGRVTFDGFAEFWPSPAGRQADPVRADLFTRMPKIVVSRTLRSTSWQNTTIIGADTDTQIRVLKRQPGKDIEIVGSATLTAHLIQAGLLDELRVMVSPIILGTGRPAFPVAGQIGLQLQRTRSFGNGNTLLVYRPVNAGNGS